MGGEGVLLTELFRDIRGGYVTIWAKREKETLTSWFDLAQPSALDEAQSEALRFDGEGYDVYFSTCPGRKRGNTKTRIRQEDVFAIPALFMDADTLEDPTKKGKRLPATRAEAVDILAALPCPPSICVSSGYGVHAYWLLEEPLTIESPADLDAAKSLLKDFARGIAETLGWADMDAHASEPARVLRVPSTHHRKSGTPLLVEVMHSSDARYPAEVLGEMMAGEPDTPLSASAIPLVQMTDRELLYRAERARNGADFARLWAGDTTAHSGDDSAADLALCNHLAYWAGKDASRMDGLFRQSGLMRNKWDERHGAQTYGEMTIAKAIADTRNVYEGEYAKTPEQASATDPLHVAMIVEALECAKASGTNDEAEDILLSPDVLTALVALEDSNAYADAKRDIERAARGKFLRNAHAFLRQADTDRIARIREQRRAHAFHPSHPLFERFEQLYSRIHPYSSSGGETYFEKEVASGGNIETVLVRLADFVCAPVEDVSRDDGDTVQREFVIEGVNRRGKQLPAVTVPARSFNGMAWTTEAWGCNACICAGQSVRDRMREAIQRAGADAPQRVIYVHTGWRQIDGHWAYLYHGGAIGAPGVSVELEGNLSGYAFPEPVVAPEDAARASVSVLDLLPLTLGVPLIAHAYLAPLVEFLHQGGAPAAHVLFLAGRTGTRKTTAAALALAHFGAGFNAKRPPASFNDTSNAVRRKSYLLKDSLLLVDDFHPTADPTRRRAMSGIAQDLARAWGDLSERGRMRADLTVKTAQPPRGLGMMTGEDLPEVSESGTARYFLVDVRPDDVLVGAELTRLQRAGRDGVLAQAMRGFIEWLLPQVETLPAQLAERFEAHRKQATAQLSGAHGRQIDAVAHLMTAFEVVLSYWHGLRLFNDDEREARRRAAWAALLEDARAQQTGMRAEDPVEVFLSSVREMVGNNRIVFPGVGTISGADAICGYMDADWMYLLPQAVYGAVQKYCHEQGAEFPISRAQLWKRMAERGLIEHWGDETTKTKRIGPTAPRVVWMKRSIIYTGSE